MTTIALAIGFVLRAPKPPQPMRLSAEIGVDAGLFTDLGPAAILSPDGTRLAFVAAGSDQKRRIYVRSLDQLQGNYIVDSLDFGLSLDFAARLFLRALRFAAFVFGFGR